VGVPPGDSIPPPRRPEPRFTPRRQTIPNPGL